LADTLNNVKIKVLNDNDCSSVFPEMVKDFSKQTCSGDINGGHDTCQGFILIFFYYLTKWTYCNWNFFQT
jgi:hypothetical protein